MPQHTVWLNCKSPELFMFTNSVSTVCLSHTCGHVAVSTETVRYVQRRVGILGFTKDGKPLVGRVLELDPLGRIFVGAGFCGHGMPVCESSISHDHATCADDRLAKAEK